MGKVDRLRNKVEPFATLFWAFGIVHTCHHLTLPAVHKAFPYMAIVCSQRRCAGPIPFSYPAMIFI